MTQLILSLIHKTRCCAESLNALSEITRLALGTLHRQLTCSKFTVVHVAFHRPGPSTFKVTLRTQKVCGGSDALACNTVSRCTQRDEKGITVREDDNLPLVGFTGLATYHMNNQILVTVNLAVP